MARLAVAIPVEFSSSAGVRFAGFASVGVCRQIECVPKLERYPSSTARRPPRSDNSVNFGSPLLLGNALSVVPSVSVFSFWRVWLRREQAM